MSDAVGQAIISDLISLCGRLYKQEPDSTRILNLHADEVAEIVRDEFITLVNKAGGAGVRVTAYTQTVNDLGAVFGSNPHKYKMMLGNFGTIFMLRVNNQETARTFTDILQTVSVRSGVPSTTSQDKSLAQGGELFSTSNTDIIQQEKMQLVVENDPISLPKGQAFVLTQGGKIYKIRIPLPSNSEDKTADIGDLVRQVNKTKKISENDFLTEAAPEILPENETSASQILHFVNWLENNIQQQTRGFEINTGKWIFASTLRYGSNTIFASEGCIAEYANIHQLNPIQVRQLVNNLLAENQKLYTVNHKTQQIILHKLSLTIKIIETSSPVGIEELANAN